MLEQSLHPRLSLPAEHKVSSAERTKKIKNPCNRMGSMKTLFMQRHPGSLIIFTWNFTVWQLYRAETVRLLWFLDKAIKERSRETKTKMYRNELESSPNCWMIGAFLLLTVLSTLQSTSLTTLMHNCKRKTLPHPNNPKEHQYRPLCMNWNRHIKNRWCK